MGKEKLVTRRSVVGGALAAGASALTLGCLDAPRAPAQAAEEPAEQPAADEAVKKAQFGFLLKVKNCVDCGECVKACRLWSRTPDSAEARRTVAPYITPAGRKVFVSTSCMHCAVPACVSVCPAGAIKKGDGGVVAVDKDRCDRLQVLLPSVSVRRAALHRVRHGQVRLLRGQRRCPGR